MMRSILSLAMLLTVSAAWAQSSEPTAQEADAFVEKVEQELAEISPSENRIFWINQTYITDDTNLIAAQSEAKATARSVRFALDAAKFKNVQDLSIDTQRKLTMLSGAITLPAPTRKGAAEELSKISTLLQSTYSTGKGTLNGQPIGGDEIEAEMGTNRDPDRLKEMWTSWHDNIGAPMRQDYVRLVAIANEGANELGYHDVGAMWRSQYDMPAVDFSALEDKLWSEVKPLYDELHCYTRTKLNEKYGDAVQSKTGPIRSDLLGNMWAQYWGPIYDIVAPGDEGDIGFDLTELLKAKGYDAIKMAKTGEGFFSSLGFDPLPETFWSRSILVKPADRDVVCHPSAWDIDNKDDLRIKMCMKVSAGDFSVIHHELGHNYYQRAYQAQTYLYQGGANDGFHEAIGDTIALSVTPDYLVKIGLLDEANVPSQDKDIGLLLAKALDRVAYLPFAVLVDKWRWGVFDGSIKPDNYNTAWNDLRLSYQGIVPPVARSEAQFDPGAKYHVASNTPYARYFLAAILQFQFYQAACREAGWTGPLHRCSFYDNRQVGTKLDSMLAIGASKPWPDALEAFTGSREMSGDSIIAYFAPLQAWLKEQNKGKSCGW